MPTKRERQYYRDGYSDGYRDGIFKEGRQMIYEAEDLEEIELAGRRSRTRFKQKPKRKLSAWNKYVKANSKKPRFRYRNGKLNLKKMAVAFRKTKKRGGR